MGLKLMLSSIFLPVGNLTLIILKFNWVKRNDLNPLKFAKICLKFNKMGANILGGCCETTPSHIKKLRSLI